MNETTQKRQRSSVDLSTMVYGKVPPNHKEMERAVLGAMLVEPKSVDRVADLLKPEAFYMDAHQRVYRAILTLVANNKPVEYLTVSKQLGDTEEIELVGGVYFLVQLSNSVVSSANIVEHCKSIHEAFLMRELIRIGGEMVNDGFTPGDATEKISENEQKFTALANLNHGESDFKRIDFHLVEVMQDIAKLKNQNDDIIGVPCGFSDIDGITHGWQEPDLIIVAARPSVGKTAFALNCARAACRKVPVGFISLEMSGKQVTQRLIAAETEIFLDRIKTGKMGDTEHEYDTRMEQMYKTGVVPLSKCAIHIYDDGDLNIGKAKSLCRRIKTKHKVGLIIIDYLQLMVGEKGAGNREQEISKISRSLKLLAKELKIPIIALSQMSRGIETRSNPEPMLADLRESGAIEQDADVVIFLYGPSQKEIDENAELKYFRNYKIAKHRNGSLDIGGLGWYPEIQLLQDKNKKPPAYCNSGPKGYIPIETANRLANQNNDDNPF